MASQNYDVKLSGKSQLHEPIVRLEDIQINLWSSDGGETWKNDKATVNVSGLLEVFMSCKAISGTEWTFVIKNTASSMKVVDEDGETGEGGEPNFSKLSKSVNP